MSELRYTTLEECERRCRMTKYMMTVILVLCGLFVTMSGWGLMASQKATTQAAEAASQLAIVATGQERDIRHLQLSVDELKMEVRALRTTLDRIGRMPQFNPGGSSISAEERSRTASN